VLISFYDDAVMRVVSATGVNERKLRDWCGRELITPDGTRASVYRGPTETAGLPNIAVDYLCEAYIIRESLQAGGVWYELIHDRLIEPIRNANQVWREHYQGPLT